MKLKPKTSYDFNADDLQFCCELMKVGAVQVLSNQVLLTSEKGNISFIEPGVPRCEGLQLPENWLIEGVYSKGFKEHVSTVHITFKVQKS